MSDGNASLEKRKFGKTLLIIGIGVPIIGCICYVIFFAGLAGLGGMY